MPWLETTADGVAVNVRVVPRASTNEVSGIINDSLKIRLQAPPVQGKANKALVKFLAKLLGVKQRDIAIVSGATARNKRVLISGLTPEQITTCCNVQ